MRYMDFGLSEQELEDVVLREAERAFGPGWRTHPPADGVLPALLTIVLNTVMENNRRLTDQLHSLGLGLRTTG